MKINNVFVGILYIIVAAFIALIASFVLWGCAARPENKILIDSSYSSPIEWEYDINKAMKRSTYEHRPLLLYFYEEDCYWCDELSSNAFLDDRVKQILNKKYVAVKIDTNNSELARQANINMVPAMLIIIQDYDKNEVEVIKSKVGYMSASQLVEFLNIKGLKFWRL